MQHSPTHCASAAEARVAVTLLGPMAVEVAGRKAGLPGRKARALLAYLALRLGSEITRETLCGLVWGDRADAQARGSLRQALTELRRSVGCEGVLLTTHDTVSLGPRGVFVDAIAFVDATGADDPEAMAAAAELYGGDLLEGFGPVDPEFDRWLAAERAALREAQMRCLTRLAELSEAAGDTTGTVALATRLLEMDDLQEHIHRILMRALARQHRPEEALRQFETLRRTLEQQLGVPPERASEELARQIRGQRQSSGTPPAAAAAVGLPEPHRPSIAVLSFRPLGTDPLAATLGEGIAEDVIIELSRTADLFVVARQSSSRFEPAAADPGEIGRALGVRYMLSGSVRAAGDRLRVAAHLVRCASGEEVWAERFDGNVREVFDIQTEIARTVTATAVGRIASADGMAPPRQRPGDLAAYELVLRGLRAMHRYTRDDMEAARDCFRAAVAREPGYGRPHGLLAMTEIYIPWYFGLDMDVSAAVAPAERAVALDERETKGHCALGITRMMARDHARANQHFETGLRYNGNDDLLVLEYGRFLMYDDRPEEGLRRVGEAMRLNPFHPNWYWNIHGRCLHTLGRFEEAIRSFERVVNPPFWTLLYLASCHAMIGNAAKAGEFRLRLMASRPDFSLAKFGTIFPYRNPATGATFLHTLHAAGVS
jgi:DNA-binding SARP family transcriptional activator